MITVDPCTGQFNQNQYKTFSYWSCTWLLQQRKAGQRMPSSTNPFPSPMPKLCSSLGKSCANCLAIIPTLDSNTDLVEIRVDLLEDYESEKGLGDVFASAKACGIQTIATCREVSKSGPGFSPARMNLLVRCIELGATYADLEVEAPEDYQKQIILHCRLHKTLVIISHHNYEKTDSSSQNLNKVLADCLAKGADIAKVAVAVESPRGAARVLALHDFETAKQIVAIGMGGYGQITRIAGLSLGAPFTFVAVDEDSLTAPGQLTRTAMRQILFDMGMKEFDDESAHDIADLKRAKN